MKFTSQAVELEELSRRTGLTLDEMANKTGINPKTLANAFSGGQKLSDHKMLLLRNIGSIGLHEMSSVCEKGVPYGEPIRRLRYIPVVSWAQAGEATAYEDLPADWMDRVPSDAKDPKAFGVIIAGDSMEPEYKEGQIAILEPNLEPRNGDAVVAKLKKGGIVMKLFHSLGAEKIKLTSYNPAYPPTDYLARDFHFIYVVDQVIKRARR